MLEYQVEIWTNTNTYMPTEAQLRYLLFLCEDREADESFWERDTLTRRDVGSIINALTKAPLRRRV